MVGGVPYMSPNMAPPPMPRGGGVGAGLQAFEAGYNITKKVKSDIDAKRTRRELDRLLVSLGDKEPTQKQYMQLMQYMGPDGARFLLQFHDQNRRWEMADRKAELETMKDQIDFVGNISDILSQTPEEQRAGMLGDLMLPLVQDNPQMLEDFGKPIGGFFQDGNFTDQKLNALKALAAGAGRYAEVHGNRLKAKAKKEAEALDRSSAERIAQTEAAAKVAEAKAKNMPQGELVKTAQEMVKTFGGRPADWVIFLREKDGDKMIGEGGMAGEGGVGGFVNKATGRPLDLGTFAETQGLPGAPMNRTPVPGSPATIKRRPPGR